jgi:HK97 family phage portal protein
LSPIYAVGLQALKALRIERNSAVLFENGARPSGILTAPGAISQATADRMKAYWEENYGTTNSGKVAVLGDGLKFEGMTMNSVDAQVIEQLKWSDTTIAGAFGVPAYKINAGGAPTYNNVEALDQQYYSGALQIHIEEIELLLDEGLELTTITGRTVGTEFDLSDLLRMDTATKIKTLMEGIKGIYTPNEARRQLQLPALVGGDTVWLQQQNWPMDILAERELPDANPPEPAPADPPEPEDEPTEEDGVKFINLFDKKLDRFQYAA